MGFCRTLKSRTLLCVVFLSERLRERERGRERVSPIPLLGVPCFQNRSALSPVKMMIARYFRCHESQEALCPSLLSPAWCGNAPDCWKLENPIPHPKVSITSVSGERPAADCRHPPELINSEHLALCGNTQNIRPASRLLIVPVTRCANNGSQGNKAAWNTA